MIKMLIGALVALPLAIGGLVVASSQVKPTQTQVAEQGYICPATGEELPCPSCCPLKGS